MIRQGHGKLRTYHNPDEIVMIGDRENDMIEQRRTTWNRLASSTAEAALNWKTPGPAILRTMLELGEVLRKL